MYTIDHEKQIISNKDGNFDLFSPEAFEMIKNLWVKVGWANKYSYQFTWLGRPIIQLPEDMIRTQEIIFSVKPSIIIETGVAHGGSLIFYASLLKILGGGKVIGVDIEIKEKNREAIESHMLADCIELVEGSSDSEVVVNTVRSFISPKDTVLVLLDSNHSYSHVLKELNKYSSMVTVGSYIVATDGIMKDLVGVPGAQSDWDWNNPQKAVFEFLRENDNFILEDIKSHFDESQVHVIPSYWPNAWLKRVK